MIALNRRAGTSPVESAATVALERILDVFCLLLLLLAALPWLPEVDWVGAAAAIALALALMLGGAALLFAIYGDRPFHALDRLARAVAVRAPRVGRARRGEPAPRARRAAGPEARADGLRPHHRGLGSDERVVLAPRRSPSTSSCRSSSGVLILAAVGFSVILPAAPGALGVFEAATVVALAAYDISASEALSYAFTLHAVNLIPYIVAGAVAVRFTRPPS